MNPLDLAFLSQIRYEERLLEAQQRRSWLASEWFRKLPRLAQIMALVLG